MHGNVTQRGKEGDLISMLIFPWVVGSLLFLLLECARGIADYGLEPVGPHRAWRRGGKEVNKYRGVGRSFF